MSQTPGASTTPATTYQERLWPGPLGWAIVLGLGLLGAAALYPVRPGLGLVGGLVFLAAACVAAYVISTDVRVHGGELHVGRAHIPVDLLGPGTPLNREGMRAALGPGSDARTFSCVRSWIDGGVTFEVVDPRDPTPAWLVSTRRPHELLRAVAAARSATR